MSNQRVGPAEISKNPLGYADGQMKGGSEYDGYINKS